MSFFDHIKERHFSETSKFPHDRFLRFWARISLMVILISIACGGALGIYLISDPGIFLILKLYLLPYINLAMIDTVIVALIGLALPLGMLAGALAVGLYMLGIIAITLYFLWTPIEAIALMYSAASYDYTTTAKVLLPVLALAALTPVVFPIISLTTMLLAAAAIFVIPALIISAFTFWGRGRGVIGEGLVGPWLLTKATWRTLWDEEPLLLGYEINEPLNVDYQVLANLPGQEPQVPHQSTPVLTGSSII